MLKKFESNDLFVNRIKTYPKVRVFTYSGSMYYNNGAVPDDGVKLFDFLMEPQAPESPIVPVTTIATEDGQFLLTENSEFILVE
jgi:hypothetical protein